MDVDMRCVVPPPTHASDATGDVMRRLGEDCEWLSRVPLESVHDRSAHCLSGSDPQQPCPLDDDDGPAAGCRLTAGRHCARRCAPCQGSLVTDPIEHRTSGLDPRMRFHPARPRQVETPTHTYGAPMKTGQAAARASLTIAKQTGAVAPRALLDAAAHRLIAEQQDWAQQDSPAEAGHRHSSSTVGHARTRTGSAPEHDAP